MFLTLIYDFFKNQIYNSRYILSLWSYNKLWHDSLQISDLIHCLFLTLWEGIAQTVWMETTGFKYVVN